MVQNNGNFTGKACQEVIKHLFLEENLGKKIYGDMSVTLGDKWPSYSTVKN
jgi:hypothetical protein